MTYLPDRDFYMEIARGNESGLSAVNKFGRNSALPNGTAEDIWDGSSAYTFISSAETMDLISTDNTNDTSIGNGAKQVEIQGLDANYALQTETVSLSSVAVPTTYSYLRIFRMKVTSVGTLENNQGTITATGSTSSTVVAQIQPGNNQTLMAIYTVPAGYTAYMTKYYFSVNSATAAATQVDVAMYISAGAGGPQQIKHFLGSNDDGTSVYLHTFGIPLVIAEKSDIRLEGEANGTADVSAGFDLVLET